VPGFFLQSILKLIVGVKLNTSSQAWLYMRLIPALEKLKRGNHEFQASLDHGAKTCLKKNLGLVEWLQW
jgi:hypothetical protein